MSEEEVNEEMQRIIKYRDQFMNEYEKIKMNIDDMALFLDIILRMNDAIRNCRKDIRMIKSGTLK